MVAPSMEENLTRTFTAENDVISSVNGGAPSECNLKQIRDVKIKFFG